MPRNSGIASGETHKRELAVWDEIEVGAVGNGAPVVTRRQIVSIRHDALKGADLICRTAGYETRTSGGVGGRGREASSYPD